MIGSAKDRHDTPTLCIDLDRMEQNIREMAGFISERDKQWRPHQKCHKTPAIAWKQIQAGAIGVTCAKVSEAEVMASGGIHDILIAHLIVGAPKIERLAALCHHADPIVTVDHFAQAEAIATLCRERGVAPRVLVDIDIGMERTGVRPGNDTLRLCKAVNDLDGLRLVGIMGYEGHLLCIADEQEKRERIHEAMTVLTHCRDMMLNEHLPCEIISAGGTGSYQITSDCEGVTELQCGGGIFADPYYQQHCGVRGLESALTILATVVSRPSLDRAILDTGRKTVTAEPMLPLVRGHEGARVTKLSAEHAAVELSGDARDLKIGDKIELIVGYADFTTPLHDAFHAFRGEQLEAIWPIAGRGKLQ